MDEHEKQALTAMITAAVIAAFEQRPRDPIHTEHHDWVRVQIEKEKARIEFRKALAQKSLPAIVWTLISGAAVGLWHLAVNHVTWK